MIEGLKLRIPSSELKEHCLARAQYHRDKADEKEKQLPELDKTATDMEAAIAKAVEVTTGAMNFAPENVARMSKSGASYNFDPAAAVRDVKDAVTSLKTDVRNHRNKALALEFIGNHLFVDDYNLSQQDLVSLEILNRY